MTFLSSFEELSTAAFCRGACHDCPCWLLGGGSCYWCCCYWCWLYCYWFCWPPCCICCECVVKRYVGVVRSRRGRPGGGWLLCLYSSPSISLLIFFRCSFLYSHSTIVPPSVETGRQAWQRRRSRRGRPDGGWLLCFYLSTSISPLLIFFLHIVVYFSIFHFSFPHSHSTIVSPSLENGQHAWWRCMIQAWLPRRRLIVVSLFWWREFWTQITLQRCGSLWGGNFSKELALFDRPDVADEAPVVT